MNDVDRTVRESAQEIHRGIREACLRSSRRPEDVVLVGASKRQPVERLRAAHEAGVLILGENRVQEAQEKIPQLPETIDWHLIGPLQSNKARRAAELFSTVHSIDRLKIASALSRVASELGETLYGFVQFNLGEEQTKSGYSPRRLDDCLRLFELPALHLRGLMAIPPPEETEEEARRWFRRLRELRDEIGERLARRDIEFRGDLSMGMSSDYQLAIEEGATHIRVGSSLFGERPTHG